MKKTARAVIIKDNKLLVFFRRKKLNDEFITYYAIPGGHVEEGETLEETVIRELKEEMNIDIKVLNYLGKLDILDKEEHYFHAEIISGTIRFGGEELERCNQDNYYEIKWLDINEIDNSGIRSIDLIKRVI